MIKTKFVFAVSFLALFVATDYAFGAIASSGYVDQQVDTRLSSITGSTTGEGNVVTEVTASGGTITATKGINAEVTSNKATAESVVADDKGSTEKYPSVAAAEKIAEVAAQTASENSLQKDGALTEGNLLKSDASGKAVDSGVASDKVLTNTATGSNSFSTGGATPVTSEGAVVLGALSSTSGNASVVVGSSSSATNDFSTALGPNTNVTATGGTAVGNAAKVAAESAIQLGYGTNNEANTLSVGLSVDNNYKLLGSDGKIPAERLPFEGDVLTNTATGSNSFSTGGANPVTVDSAVAFGGGASVTKQGGVAHGASASVSGLNSVAVGTSASALSSFSVAAGFGASAKSITSVALGGVSASEGSSSISIGYNAKTTNAAANSIQLGTGTNSEANTLSVGLSSSNNYKLLGSDGKIPAERMPDTILVNETSDEQSVAIGTGKNSSGNGGIVAIGVNASAGGLNTVTVGFDAVTMAEFGVAVGSGADAGANAVAVGYGASASRSHAIQLGTGTNSEANTFSVGLSDSNNYKLLGSDGKIPSERLPAAMIPVGSSTSPTSYATFWIE